MCDQNEKQAIQPKHYQDLRVQNQTAKAMAEREEAPVVDGGW